MNKRGAKHPSAAVLDMAAVIISNREGGKRNKNMQYLF